MTRTVVSLAVLLVFAGCGGEMVEGDGVEAHDVSSEALPTPSVPTLEFATHFSVSAGPGYRLVETAPDPESLASSSDRSWASGADRMVLIERGTRPDLPPELASLPRFEVPVVSVTTNRDADALRVKVLGHLDRLRGIGGTGIYDEDIRRLVETGQIGSVGSALHRTTNIEFLLTEGVQAAFFRVASLEHSTQFERIREVGVPAVPMFAWAERSYLGRAEWIKYLAMFLGADREAEQLFEGMRARRDSLMARVAGSPGVPTLWAYRSGDRWIVHRNSLESELLADAGGENVLQDESAGVTAGEGGFSEGVPMTDEEFLIAAEQAEYWITWDRSDEQWPSRRYLDRIPAYRDGRVFHHRVRLRPEQGGDDWYESAQVDPISVLADLIALLHPDRMPSHEFVWLAPLERTR